MVDDVVLNKAAAIERAVARVREVHAGHDGHVLRDQTRQDSILLNLQRACETAIDLAMHLVRVHRLGVPQESRQAFDLLAEHGAIPRELAERMKKMVGFRNVAVHEYRAIDLEIVVKIIHHRLDDFLDLVTAVLQPPPPP
jgi:uncharacterized protein YutE (UPF0331/DUF86 family)